MLTHFPTAVPEIPVTTAKPAKSGEALISRATGAVRKLATDAEGRFHATQLDIGAYPVAVENTASRRGRR